MKRLLWFAGAVAVAASLLPAPASAQAPGGPAPYVPPSVYNPFQRPIFSPYLGLGLPGNRGINYTGLVLPQIQQGVAIQQLEGQALLTQRQLAAGTTGYGTGVLVTGHPFGFQTQYGYFQNWAAGGTGTGLGTGVGRPGFGGLYGPGGLSGGLGGGYGGVGAAAGLGFGVARTGTTTTASGLSLVAPLTTPRPPPKR
jgi:hypothetical protein